MEVGYLKGKLLGNSELLSIRLYNKGVHDLALKF